MGPVMRDVDLALSVPRTAWKKKRRGIPKLLLLKWWVSNPPEPVEAPPEEPKQNPRLLLPLVP